MSYKPFEHPERATVLVVDDTQDNLALISGLLKQIYSVKVANSGEKALGYLKGNGNADLILLDIMMPGLSGYDVLRELRADPRTNRIPVIFLTAMSTAMDEEKGLQMGAADYISKPISPPILLARIKTQLENKAAADFLRNQNAYLEDEVTKRTREISAIQDVTILALASLAETRDLETGSHIRRTQFYVRVLAEKLKTHPRFRHFLSDQTISMLYKSAPLHDIGKVGIPDRILLKPGPLDPEEFEIMKKHISLGSEAIDHAEKQLGTPVEFLTLAKEIVLYHQEKWDGSGYLTGARGDSIPISARLMALADVYDALISRRVYKAGMPHDKAVTVIIEGKGTHFDPDVVDAFAEVAEQFRAIAATYADSEPDMATRLRHYELFTGSRPDESA